jgi:hypothetical protein
MQLTGFFNKAANVSSSRTKSRLQAFVVVYTFPFSPAFGIFIEGKGQSAVKKRTADC